MSHLVIITGLQWVVLEHNEQDPPIPRPDRVSDVSNLKSQCKLKYVYDDFKLGLVLHLKGTFLSEPGAEPNPTERPSTTHSRAHTISTIIPLTVALFVRQHHACIIQFIASTYIH